MSFGKDDKNLGNVASYGGTTRQRAANAGRKRTRSGGGRRPYWSDTYRPSEHQIDSIRLIAGEYKIQRADGNGELYEEVLPWWECKEHYHGGIKRGGICSGGPLFFDRKRRLDCYGCNIYWNDSGRGDRDKRIISIADKFVFRVVDFGQFHKVPQTDKNGQFRLDKENQPYMEWAKCTGMGCTGCQNAKESKFGYIQPWIMSKTHFNSLNGYADSIGTSCTTCLARGVISTCMWQCANQECGELIFDIATSTATQEQVDEIVNAPFGCATCQQKNYPEEVIQCVNCTPQGTDPVRASIFDVDMQVKTQKTGDGDQTALLVIATSDPKPIDDQFKDLLEFAPNLEKRFAPTSLEDQAAMWKIQRTNKEEQNPANYAQGYGQGQDQGGQPQQ